MNRRNAMVTAVGLLAISQGTLAAAEDEKPDARLYEGVPSMTVQEFSEGLLKEGYQHRFLAQQLCFQCTFKPFKGEFDQHTINYCQIDGLARFPLALLFNLVDGIESQIVAGLKLDVHGLILEQCYGVWRIWVYSARPIPLAEANRSHKN